MKFVNLIIHLFRYNIKKYASVNVVVRVTYFCFDEADRLVAANVVIEAVLDMPTHKLVKRIQRLICLH